MRERIHLLACLLAISISAVSAFAFSSCESGGSSDLDNSFNNPDNNSDNTSASSDTVILSDVTYTRCDENGKTSLTGNYVKFGSYPQTEVTDTALTASLTDKAGALPTSDFARKWTSYEYYANYSNSTDYMWYIDIAYGGAAYRGVYFTSYRPYLTGENGDSDNSRQDENGYNTDTVYWFKYEPILWRILSENGDVALILSETIIDSQQYYRIYYWDAEIRSAVDNYDDSYYAGKTETVTESVYANNYKYSDIRAWLNETFYNTAFSPAQKSLIQTTAVDNSALSTANDGRTSYINNYACEDANDKVFLLSQKEVTTAKYGFADYDTYDTARQKQPSEYAKSQGGWTSTSSSYLNCGYWWLRSSCINGSNLARSVFGFGIAYSDDYVDYSEVGVVPALQISLKK